MSKRGRPPLPPELRQSPEEKKLKQKENFAKWYHSKSPEEKRKYNIELYKKRKERLLNLRIETTIHRVLNGKSLAPLAKELLREVELS